MSAFCSEYVAYNCFKKFKDDRIKTSVFWVFLWHNSSGCTNYA